MRAQEVLRRYGPGAAAQARSAVRDIDAAVGEAKTKYSLTNGNVSRGATLARRTAKLDRMPLGFVAARERRKKTQQLQRRAERRLLASTAAATLARANEAGLIPGKGAPFEVLRGGRPRTLANAVRASALHPAVSAPRYRA